MTVSKPKLALVAKPAIPLPYDEEKAKGQMVSGRARLLKEAVRYVRDGKDGNRCERLRTASNLSGIPINLIDVEARK